MFVLSNEIGRDAEHRYWTPEGRRVVGVSEVLQHFGFVPDFNAPYLRDAAAYRSNLGTQVHKAVHLKSLGELDAFSLDPAIEPHLISLARFEAKRPLTYLHNETLVYDPLRRYAGQLDMVVRLGNEIWLLDLKTGGVYPGAKYQAAAYAQCLPKELLPVRRGALKTFDDGSEAEIVPFSNATDTMIFNGLVAAFYRKVDDGLLKWDQLKEAA